MKRENVLSAGNQQGRLRKSLNKWYVSGFVDGEGSFHIALYKDAEVKTGWRVIPEFHVSQRISSKNVLDEIKDFFGCGYVKANHAKNPSDVTYVYVVRNRHDLLTEIIPFFEKYALRTEKSKDAEIFSRIVRMMSNGQHLSRAGLNKIVKLAYQMNGQGRYRKRKEKTIV